MKIIQLRKKCFITTHLHFVRLFWNHVFTWASVIFKPRANAARSADAKYFCLWKRFSNSATWILQGAGRERKSGCFSIFSASFYYSLRASALASTYLVKDVRGFFLFGGVRFWYGCPILLAIGNAGEYEYEMWIIKWNTLQLKSTKY